MLDKIIKYITYLNKDNSDFNVNRENLIYTTNDGLQIDLLPFWGVSFVVEKVGDIFCFYNSIRTSSWIFGGDRTDLHDIISICYSLLLDDNITIIDIQHPIIGFEDEIYARILLPHFHIINSDNFKEIIDKQIFFANCFAQIMVGNYLELNNKTEIPDVLSIKPIPQHSKINEIYKNANCIESSREFPGWEYKRYPNKQVCIIKSKIISLFLNLIQKNYTVIEGVNSLLFIGNGDLNKYALSNKLNKQLNSIAKKLKEKVCNYHFLNNKVIVQSEQFIIFLDAECGKTQFDIEKEKIRIRHENENKYIFNTAKVIWQKKIAPDKFEDLVYDLLSKHPEVSWVRKVSSTYEPDGGRDLIAEIIVSKDNVEENKPIYELKKIIVQCKAYSKGISKRDVLDIRDMLEYYDCDGYWLITTSHLTKGLTDYLCKLRYANKIWTEWWTRIELENELSKYDEEFLSRYLPIFSIQK